VSCVLVANRLPGVGFCCIDPRHAFGGLPYRIVRRVDSRDVSPAQCRQLGGVKWRSERLVRGMTMEWVVIATPLPRVERCSTGEACGEMDMTAGTCSEGK
jgi:hypothetical protein